MNRVFIVLVISVLVSNFPVVTYGKLTNERIVLPYLADILGPIYKKYKAQN